jgi:phenylacetate-coenzyme A ligase PaaK-like adenylate-forming protein
LLRVAAVVAGSRAAARAREVCEHFQEFLSAQQDLRQLLVQAVLEELDHLTQERQAVSQHLSNLHLFQVEDTELQTA